MGYLGLTAGPPDLFAHGLAGYGLLQALMLLRLLPWLLAEPFGASYWAFTFSSAALALASLRMIEHGEAGPFAVLAPVLFLVANSIVLLVAWGTVRLLLRGQLLPATRRPAEAL